MIFDRFKDEAAFRTDFIRPLLTRLGFIAVAELHGTQEFGKDFVFSELTPFGFIRHYAAVVKHEKSIGQPGSSLCMTILAQVRQAFSVTFRLPDNDAVHKVSSVVVFNSGKVSDNARTWLRTELGEERYGRNVHLFDGERLFQLDVSGSVRVGESLLPRLRGLVNDLDLNLIVLDSIRTSLPGIGEGRGCFTNALDSFLASPFLTDRIDIQDVAHLVQECRIIDTICHRYLFSKLSDTKENDIETLTKLVELATQRSHRLIAQIRRAQMSFRPLTAQQ